MTIRHFLQLSDCSTAELLAIIKSAQEHKLRRELGQVNMTFPNKVLAMIFEMSSTRTRVGFEAAMSQLGGRAIFLNRHDTQLGRGEPIEDTAKVVSRMVDLVMIRTAKQETIEKFATASNVPVINGMSSTMHPCQLLADIQTFMDHRGSIEGKNVAFIGDGYNMCHSYIEASHCFNFNLAVATPINHAPQQHFVDKYGRNVNLLNSVETAVQGADLIVTDVWSSIGHEDDVNRVRDFEGYQVTEELLDLAAPDVVFLHCLPAHRGEEVNHTVLDDKRSQVWEEAENRLHTQKALIEFLLTR